MMWNTGMYLFYNAVESVAIRGSASGHCTAINNPNTVEGLHERSEVETRRR